MNLRHHHNLSILMGALFTTLVLFNVQAAFSASETESIGELATSSRCQGLKGAALIACRVAEGPTPSPHPLPGTIQSEK